MRQKVLIIDDSPLIASLIQTRLGDEPIDFQNATTGRQGIELAATSLPDLILLDVDMPVMDGFAVCCELKSRAETMHVPIVFMAGVMSSDLKIKGLDLGAIDYLTKPFDPAELRARVRASLRTSHLLDLLAKKAQVDGLTGLWNRAYFDQRLASEISLSQRTNAPIACVLVDLDGLKPINDRLGHSAGDEVIRRAGQLLVECVRLEDIVCRYSGGMFAIIMPNIAPDRAHLVAERMRQLIGSAPFEIRGERLGLTASLGVGAAHGLVETTLHTALAAVRRAKVAGGNRIEHVSANDVVLASAS
jgi:diguanylate cyclase (GGDEF)-like protein